MVYLVMKTNNQKPCTKCGDVKYLHDFSPRKDRPCPYDSQCKKCRSTASTVYHRTKKGIAKKIYSTQLRSSRVRGHSPPNYTLQELRCWLDNKDNFNSLFNKWVTSGFDKNLVPSCDRINDYLPYTFTNLRLVTWSENKKKHYSDRRKGINNKTSKKVSQFTKEGIFVATYASLAIASRATGIDISNISKCQRGIFKSSGNYIWR